MPSTSTAADETSSTEALEVSSSLKVGTLEDRDEALKSVAKNAGEHWTSLPLHWQTDKEFVLTALLESPSLPSKSDFERKFPQTLRFDKEVVLGFCHRPDFQELYQNRHLFVPGCLTGDKQVMLAYCQKIPRSLQECAEELTDSPEIVIAAITLGGLELQYASLRLQEDKETVKQACTSHGRALEFCPPGKTRSELVQDRDFMLNTVLAKPGGGPMWRLLAPQLRDDSELLLMALKNGMLLRDVPKDFMNIKFLTFAVQSNAALFMELPKAWQSKSNLAREAILSQTSSPEIHTRVLEQCPGLKRDRDVVLQIARLGSLEFLKELLSDDQFQYLDDLQVMKLAIERDTNFFTHASRRLQQTPEIIIVSITPISAWNTLKVVPWSIQRSHPAIPIKAITVTIPRNLRYLPSHIPEDLWTSNRDLGIAWIRRGGRVLDSLERLLRNDPDMGLEVAKHNWSEFYKVGDQLLRNRAFMLQALEQDGRVIRFANSALTQDVDILVTAVAYLPQPGAGAGNQRSAQYFSNLQTTFNGICNLDELKDQIQRKLTLQSTFMLDFLRGIAISPEPNVAPNLRSQLPMLDRGIETSQAFKQLIANYLGVPIGKELGLLRRAIQNLQNPPPSSSASHASTNRAAARAGPRGGNLVMGGAFGAQGENDEVALIQHHRRARRLVHLRQRMHMRHGIERIRPRARWPAPIGAQNHLPPTNQPTNHNHFLVAPAAARAQNQQQREVAAMMIMNAANAADNHRNRNAMQVGEDEEEEAEEERILAAAMARHRQQQEDEINNPQRNNQRQPPPLHVPDNRLLLLQEELERDLDVDFVVEF